MYHISGVTCHTFSPIFFLLERGGVSWWRVCYQWGFPRLVFKLFLVKYTLIPKLYLFQFVVVQFWSLLKQIDENLILEGLE